MTKKNLTKKALFNSAVALFLCFAMLLGTTYAWFTDSASSGSNIITSGNLDVEVRYSLNGTDWDALDGATNLFQKGLWEPGHVEIVYLEITNQGSLALKYQLGVNVYNETPGVNVAGETFKLSDHLVFTTVEMPDALTTYSDREAAALAAGTQKGLKDYNGKTTALDAKGSANDKDYVALIVYMPETVGNEANYRGSSIPTIDLGINLYATQYTAESDSFGTDYDKDATHEEFKVTTAEDLQAAINAGETNIVVISDIELDEAIVIPEAASTYSMRAAANAITINLNGKTISIAAEYSDANATASSAIVNNGNLVLTGNGTVKAINNYTVRNYGAMVIDGIAVENGIMNFAALTVESGNISNSRSGKHTIYNYNAELTINGGAFYNGNPGNATIFANGGEAALNGGEYTIADGTATQGWTSCLIDAQGNAKYTISGGDYAGTLRDYNNNTVVTGGNFTSAPTGFIAEGHTAVDNGNGTITVLKGNVAVDDANGLQNALNSGEKDIALSAGNFTLPATSGDVTISGTTDTVINITTPTANKITLNGVTVISGAYKGIQHSSNVTYENCVLTGGDHFLYADNVIIKNCVIELAADQYVWTYSAKNVEFIDCTFNTAGKAILMYNEGPDLVTTVSVKGCTFNATANVGKAAIEIGSGYAVNGHYTLVTENNTVDSDFSGEWRIKDCATNNTTVNGVIYNRVNDGLYKGEQNAYYVYNANGLEALNTMISENKLPRAAYSISLLADIDFSGKTWKTVDSHVDFGAWLGEINGNDYTISNLTINGQAMFSRFAGSGDVVIRDITFDNANVNSNGNINTAILVAHTYQNVLLDNVDVKNSTIIGGYKVAPLIGTVYNENTTSITATLKDCDVENVTVKATSYDFCTAGMVAFVYAGDNDKIEFENCTVSNVKLYAPNVYTAHAAIYTTGSENLFNEAEGVTVTNVTFENT